MVWLECKWEVGSSGADPHAESLVYYHYFLQSKDLTNRLLPGLQVDIVGCTLR